MLDHVLIAFDDSESARKAARYGLSLARLARAKVTLLTVLHSPVVVPVGPLSGYAVLQKPPTEAEVAHARQKLEQLAQMEPELKCEFRVELGGDPAETIVDVANSASANLIVIGARGLGIARRFLLGSVSDRVAHHAHCPVTIWR